MCVCVCVCVCVFTSFAFKPPASGLHSYSFPSIASQLFHPYHTDDKTSRLMEKRFSMVRETQTGSQSYMEKRRGRRERGDKEEERGNQNGREESSQ